MTALETGIKSLTTL